MIVDYRIYVSVLVLAFIGYFATCFVGMATVGNDRAQLVCNRVWLVFAALLFGTGTLSFLDWLWS